MPPQPWHMHLDPCARGYALGVSTHKAHREGAKGCMLGKGSNEQQHEQPLKLGVPAMGGWFKDR